MIGYRVEKLLIFIRFRGPEALNDNPEAIETASGLTKISEKVARAAAQEVRFFSPSRRIYGTLCQNSL
jgi:hypothetical protein